MTQRNRTRKANPNQLALSSEYRGWIKRCPKRETSNPTPPDFEGTCTLNGDSYWISGWINRRAAKPVLDLVFQLAVKGTRPYQFKPEDLRLKAARKEKPTREALDWTHYMQAPREHRESGECETCNRVHADLDAKFGADAPY